jgi:mannonate dehydratase
MKPVTIAQVRPIVTAPEGRPLVVVRVDTSEDGLYGYGCATFTQRALTVAHAVQTYLAPWATGKEVHRIEEIWHSAMASTFWRNGPILNAALSGLDMALWDIKGKLAGLPCYELWGGKSREAAAVYRHADGQTLDEVVENVRRFVDQGYRYIRCQWGGYGGMQGASGQPQFFNPLVHSPQGALPGEYFDPHEYRRRVPKLLERVRQEFGTSIELLHDVHERLQPADALRLAKDVEPFDLYFLEDLLPPEQVQWLQIVRQQTSVPLAISELFTHPLEWTPLITHRWIDFIRIHISQIGGVTPALKIAHLCEMFGVRTAWQAPKDVSPVGHMAQLHFEVNVSNFGVHEWGGWGQNSPQVFLGLPEVKDGYMYPNTTPGWGMEVDERAAAQFPVTEKTLPSPVIRIPDGTAVWP